VAAPAIAQQSREPRLSGTAPLGGRLGAARCGNDAAACAAIDDESPQLYQIKKKNEIIAAFGRPSD
jgi:hypothetical protein